MKTLNKIILGVLVLGAVNARASWTVTAVTDPVNINNLSGPQSTTFSFKNSVAGTLYGSLLTVSDNNSPYGSWTTAGGSPFTSFAIVSDSGLTGSSIVSGLLTGGNYAANTSFSVVVDWATATAGNYAFDLKLFTNPAKTQTTGNNFDINVTAVPEPTQVVAGAMLLGCGGLVFIGRRLMKKQA